MSLETTFGRLPSPPPRSFSRTASLKAAWREQQFGGNGDCFFRNSATGPVPFRMLPIGPKS